MRRNAHVHKDARRQNESVNLSTLDSPVLVAARLHKGGRGWSTLLRGSQFAPRLSPDRKDVIDFMRLLIRLGLCLSVPMVWPVAVAAQTAQNVAVVINDNDPGSQKIGEYYVQQRAV